MTGSDRDGPAVVTGHVFKIARLRAAGSSLCHTRRMPEYRVVFVNGEKRELTVGAHKITGNDADDRGNSYTFHSGSTVIAVIPKAQVLFIEKVN